MFELAESSRVSGVVNVILVHPGLEVGRRYVDWLGMDGGRCLIWLPDLSRVDNLPSAFGLLLLDSMVALRITQRTFAGIKARSAGKIVVLAEEPRIAEAVGIIRRGADDYQGYPGAREALRALVDHWISAEDSAYC
ncbi:hypothetical protein SDC9_88374 [bioreactor metagenome]|uniref:Uncharacterized protein n=1 Tax=bioreactor metagenome TaxID=1076179 RepID=A0A644ZMX7_9ZZZZ